MIKPYYSDDYVQIFHGDCREILPQLPKVDLVLTDPPYGSKQNLQHSRRGRGGDFLKGIITIARDWDECIGDNEDFEPSHILEYGQVIIWGANYFSHLLPTSSKWLIWDKRDGVSSDDNADCEIAWTNLKGVSRIYRQLWKGICRQGRENIAIQHEKLHPFQKPVALMEWCILQANKADMILDPYLGSGSTVRAALNLNRKCIGIEIEEKYCEIAAKRCSQQVFDFSGVSK